MSEPELALRDYLAGLQSEGTLADAAQMRAHQLAALAAWQGLMMDLVDEAITEWLRGQQGVQE